MPVNSTAFRSQNTIINSFKLVHAPGWTVSKGDASDGIDPSTAHNVGAADGLDLNGNGQIDPFSKPVNWSTTAYGYSEPTLTVSTTQIHDFASRQGTEVVTAADAPSLMMEDYTFNLANHNPKKNYEVHSNQRSLGTLVKQFAPLDDKASWAIDTTTQELLIFVPKP